MITSDQPTFLPDDLMVRISSRSDGTVLDRSLGTHVLEVIETRQAFCEANGVSYGDVVYQWIIYGDDQTYEHIEQVDEGSTTKYVADVAADALFTSAPGVGLFLPVADCVATVVYDPVQRNLALLHLGRHATLANLLPKTLEVFASKGSKPHDLVVWMSPSAGRATYKLDYFDRKDDPAWKPYCDIKQDGIYIDMQGFNRQRLLDAGVKPENIHMSPINTMMSDDYFSHAAGDVHGRQAVLAMMR
jgi:copper oxidase (laccase) domain-containing protein